jgi:peptidoglycan/LPS O-acetylase OafA/YrhL
MRVAALAQEPPIAHATSSKPGSRILGLDGLRAFSISLVLIGHLLGTRGFHPPEVVSRVLGLFFLGPLGVRVFFVISGFLITSLLMEEERRTGTVSLSRFYFRRTLRIFPPHSCPLKPSTLSMAVASSACPQDRCGLCSVPAG